MPVVSLSLGLAVAGLLIGFLLLASVPTPGRAGGEAVGPVSVIIPARNEAVSLPLLLESLAGQVLGGGEVIVVDDGSTDDTAALASAAGATVIQAPPVPAGWIGKSWACHVGSLHARSGVLVFLDADVVLGPDGLGRIVAAWRREVPDGLLSVQPFHTTRSAYEQLSAYPNLMAMMASGCFAPGRRHWSPVAFGPCMVTSRTAYRTVGGHEAVGGEVIEDIHLARVYGAAGRPVRTLAGGTAASFRMYPSGLRQLVDGWTKNLAGGPRLVSPLPMLGAALWVISSIGVASDLTRALVAAATGGDVRWAVFGAWALAAAQVSFLLRRIGRFAWWAGPAFPLLLAGFVALFARSSIHRLVRRSVQWHGRSVAVRVR